MEVYIKDPNSNIFIAIFKEMKGLKVIEAYCLQLAKGDFTFTISDKLLSRADELLTSLTQFKL